LNELPGIYFELRLKQLITLFFWDALEWGAGKVTSGRQ